VNIGPKIILVGHTHSQRELHSGRRGNLFGELTEAGKPEPALEGGIWRQTSADRSLSRIGGTPNSFCVAIIPNFASFLLIPPEGRIH
jgi:hypothetical protein